MALRLIVTAGVRLGEEFSIRDPVIIGRNQGDLRLRDPKVSNPHSRIIGVREGNPEIEDMGSTNGTYVNGQKVQRSPIKPGDTLLIGRTTLKVEEAKPRLTDVAFEEGSWQKTMVLAMDDALSLAEKRPVKTQGIHAFSPAVKLRIVSGFSTGHEVVFGFGPRIVGPGSQDFFIYEPNTKSVWFEIDVTREGEFLIRPKTTLSLNGNLISDQATEIKIGDVITIGDTSILVEVEPV